MKTTENSEFIRKEDCTEPAYDDDIKIKFNSNLSERSLPKTEVLELARLIKPTPYTLLQINPLGASLKTRRRSSLSPDMVATTLYTKYDSS